MNKKRLAALAMSAVMAAGTVSIPVNAADFSDGAAVQEDFTADVATQSTEPEVTEDETDAVGATITKIVDTGWTDEETDSPSVEILITYADGSTKPDKITKNTEGATFTKKTLEASCTKGAGYQWIVSYLNYTFESKEVRDDKTAGHKYEDKIEDVWNGDCSQPKPAEIPTNIDETYKGYYKVQRVGKCCTECGAWETGATYVVKEPEHLLDGKNIIEYKAGENTVLVNGDSTKVPVLNDKTEPGEYVKITYQTCLKGTTHRVEIGTETIKLSAEEDKVEDHISISNIENIDSAYATAKLTNIKDAKDLPKNEDVVLADCSKEGSYVIKYWTKNADEENDTPLRTQTVTIAAHHVTKEGPTSTVEAVNKDDQKLLTWKWDAENEKMVVANSSCVKEVEYYVVTKCASKGLDGKGCSYETKSEKRTAAKSNNHTYNLSVYNEVDNFKAGEFSALEKIVEADKEHVKIVPVTATCEKAGTVNVEFYCVACGEKAKTIEDVEVTKLGHEEVTKVENEVKATCTTAGSYTAVTSCERCGKEISKKNVVIKRLAHTNENSIELINGKPDDKLNTIKGSEASIQFVGSLVFGPYEKGDTITIINDGSTPGTNEAAELGGVYPENGETKVDGTVGVKVVTNCAVCHNHEVVLTNDVKVEVKAVTPETKNVLTGNVTAAGSITLVATYTEAGQKDITKEITLPYFSGPMDTTLAYTGLHLDVDGVYRYYVDGEFDEDYAGIVEFDNKEFFVANGVLCKDAMGVNQNVDGKWYFLSYGQVQTQHTGLAEYDGEWFYINNGVLNEDVTGLIDYDGGTFLFIEGRLAKEVNGLWQNFDGKWYFLANGQVQKQHTGLALYDGEWFYVVDGMLAEDFTGNVEYDGETFKVVNGMLR